MKTRFLHTTVLAGLGLALAAFYPVDANAQANLGVGAGADAEVGAGAEIGGSSGADAEVGVGAGAETGIDAGAQTNGADVGAEADAQTYVGGEAGAMTDARLENAAHILINEAGGAQAGASVDVIADTLAEYEGALSAGDVAAASDALASAAAAAGVEAELDEQVVGRLNAELGLMVDAETETELAARING